MKSIYTILTYIALAILLILIALITVPSVICDLLFNTLRNTIIELYDSLEPEPFMNKVDNQGDYDEDNN